MKQQQNQKNKNRKKRNSIKESLRSLADAAKREASSSGSKFSKEDLKDLNSFFKENFPEASKEWDFLKKEISESVNDAQEGIEDKIENLDDWVVSEIKKHPYKSLGLAGLTGVLLGMYLGRKI